ncbi:hypothetical protein IWQ62_006856, partial [Dispira parvispora]
MDCEHRLPQQPYSADAASHDYRFGMVSSGPKPDAQQQGPRHYPPHSQVAHPSQVPRLIESGKPVYFGTNPPPAGAAAAGSYPRPLPANAIGYGGANHRHLHHSVPGRNMGPPPPLPYSGQPASV